MTGIYLVAAFASEHWLSGDSLRSKARKHDPDALRHVLEDEAERLSTDSKTVHVRVVPFKLLSRLAERVRYIECHLCHDNCWRCSQKVTPHVHRR